MKCPLGSPMKYNPLVGHLAIPNANVIQRWPTTFCLELAHPLCRKTLQRSLCHRQHMPPSEAVLLLYSMPASLSLFIPFSSACCGNSSIFLFLSIGYVFFQASRCHPKSLLLPWSLCQGVKSYGPIECLQVNYSCLYSLIFFFP